MSADGVSGDPIPPGAGRCDRVVLALLLADDTAVAALDEDRGALPERWRRRPVAFSEGLPPWTIAATIGTGAMPLRHRVLSAAALDPKTLAPRPRRASDAGAPWLWQRLAAAGRASVVVGWPGVQRLDGDGDSPPPPLHAATLAAVRQPRRLLGLAPALDAPIETLVAPPRCASLVGETSLAALRALPDASSDAARIVAAVLAAAEALGRAAAGDGFSPALVALGLDLRSRVDTADPPAAAAPVPESPAERVIEPACEALARLAGDAPLLVVLQGATRAHLLLCGVDTTEATATPIDLAPTVLTLLGLPVPADLPGVSLCSGATAARTWDLGAWPAAADSASPADDPIERALAVLDASSASGTIDADQPANAAHAALRALLTQHFETLWQIALRLADWSEAAKAATALRRLHGREIDLWRCAVAAERCGDLGTLAAAGKDLRETFPQSRSAALLPLLGPDAVDLAAQRALLETIEITSDLLPTQRSAIGRAAARAGLDDLARRALAPLVANGLAIPADRIALATLLQRVGEPQRAVAALGSIGLGAQSPPRLRLLRARCLHEAGFDDRAIALLEQHLATTPFDGEAKTLLATIRARPSR